MLSPPIECGFFSPINTVVNQIRIEAYSIHCRVQLLVVRCLYIGRFIYLSRIVSFHLVSFAFFLHLLHAAFDTYSNDDGDSIDDPKDYGSVHITFSSSRL